MGQHTPLFEEHLRLGAKMVDFAGWDMPIHYGSQVEEHHCVRRDAGMFDVSHMTIIDLHGERVREYLRYLAANNVDKLQQPGKALYSCMLNQRGGVIDDLIIYFLEQDFFRLVVNSATRDKDLAWISEQGAPFGVQVTERPELAMIAVQGPQARARVESLLEDEAQRALVAALKPFQGAFCAERFIARTGYSGEDGYEVMLPAGDAVAFWRALAAAGVHPCGLGARDTLRLEAGMALYGTDMDERVSPLESGLAWTVAWEPAERDFIGRAALEKQRADGPERKLVGLVLEDKGVLRNHQKVVADGAAGEVTSGSFSPTLGRSIALARVARDTGEHCQVEVRGRLLNARVVKPPFVRHGKALVEL